MGTSKPLLPLGAGSVIERVIGTVARAGVDKVVVVTGHRTDEVAPVVEGLGVRTVYNPAYETGMFSSVRAGVGALTDEPDAFFILPVDCALVRPEALRLLMRSRVETPGAIFHPACCGVRGHPPLLSGRYREELERAGAGDDLRSFLRRHPDAELDVDVEDLTILMDMDTPEDYERLRRFAAILDAAENAGGAGPAATTAGAGAPAARAGAPTPRAAAKATPTRALNPDEALYLLGLLQVPDRVVRHCRTVAAVGVTLAVALKPRMADLDVELVRCGGLLHDMAKAARKHGVVGKALLENLGLPRLGSVVGSHMVMAPEQLAANLPTEEQLVYLADKLVVEDRVTSLEERAARTLRKHAGDAEVVRGVEARMWTSRLIARQVETIAGRALDEIVAVASTEAAPDV